MWLDSCFRFPDCPKQPLQALTSYLPATYRICNPNFKYESSRNPRRVLTKPSKGVKNDGYDNEDSDYILYVNDILGSEETKYVQIGIGNTSMARMRADYGLCYRNRYLILDVLGQGTFGQVVKCQNLKTQEVVAVKVVKNRTAYFNQSMMEVSVLDLVSDTTESNRPDPSVFVNRMVINNSSIANWTRTTITIYCD